MELFIDKNPDIDPRTKAKMYYKCSEWAREKEDDENYSKNYEHIL